MSVPAPPGVFSPVKRHRGEPGHTRTHESHRRTSQASQPTNAPKRPRDDRISGRLNGRSPGADRSPRPTRRPPPANPTQPPPAPPGGAGHTHAPDHTRTPRPDHPNPETHTSPPTTAHLSHPVKLGKKTPGHTRDAHGTHGRTLVPETATPTFEMRLMQRATLIKRLIKRLCELCLPEMARVAMKS